jgi:pyridoxal phosphate enzyme (YggS family)
MAIAQQYQEVADEVAKECRACGRDPQDVTLVAVSKTVTADRVAEAIGAGAHDFGENRPDQIVEKHALYPQMKWHFIGNIQSRRIHEIVPCAALIHSVYQEHHLGKIDEAAQACGKVQDILLEVNVSGEQSKGGATPQEAADLLRAALRFPHLRVRGLMTMAPQGDLAVAERCFADLRALRDTFNDEIIAADDERLSELSMGMSEDWRCAIEQGATIVRIGRAIFSEDFA